MSNMRIKCKKLKEENNFLKYQMFIAKLVVGQKRHDLRLLQIENAKLCERMEQVMRENAALRDKIEQAERAMRPFLK